MTVTQIVPDLAHVVQKARTMSQTRVPLKRRVISLGLHQAKRKTDIPNIAVNIEARVVHQKGAPNINIAAVGQEAKLQKSEKAVKRIVVDLEAQVTPGAQRIQRNAFKVVADPLVNTEDIERVHTVIVDHQVAGSTSDLEVVVGPQMKGNTENLLEAAAGLQENKIVGKSHKVVVSHQEAEERKVAVNHQGRAAVDVVEAHLQIVTGRVREEAIEDHDPDQGGCLYSFIIISQQIVFHIL